MITTRSTLTGLAAGFLLLAAGCTNEEAARETLRKHGFHQVEITGHRAFQCGEGDATSTGFRATNPSGERVEGTVCCGRWSKGCTIRF